MINAMILRGQLVRMAAPIMALLIIAFAESATAQEWTVGAPPGDDRKDVICWIKNGDGHTLILRSKEENERYWILAELQLGHGLVFGNSLPSFQVDDRKQIDLNWQIGHGERHKETWAEVGTTTTYWTMWSFFEKEITEQMTIVRWFEGKEVKISFALSNGSTGSTSFPLAGLSEIVPQVTGYKIVEEDG